MKTKKYEFGHAIMKLFKKELKIDLPNNCLIKNLSIECNADSNKPNTIKLKIEVW